MASSSGAGRRLILGVIVSAAIVAALFGASNGQLLGVSPRASLPTESPTAPHNPVDAQPAPSLFKDADLLPVESLLPRQDRRAEADLDEFYGGQPAGRVVDDAAFVDWASDQVGTPPSNGQRQAERSRIEATLGVSAKNDRAARWLGLHGCRDVWTSYLLEHRRFHPSGAAVGTEADLDAVLDLAVRVAAAAQQQAAGGTGQRSTSPCAPSGLAFGGDTCCAFPSAAAAMAAAARTVLSALEPMSRQQYAWMEKQVDMAGLYRGLEVPSDVESGAYLGYLTGTYFLASRGYGEPTPTPSPTTPRQFG